MLTPQEEIEAWRTAKPADAPFRTQPCCGRAAQPPGGMTPIFGVMSALEANLGDATEREIRVELEPYRFSNEDLRAAAAALEAAGLITTSRADSADDCGCGSDACTGCTHLHMVFEPVAPGVA